MKYNKDRRIKGEATPTVVKRCWLIWDHMFDYQEAHGFSLTVRELCEKFEINSTSHINNHLKILEAVGLLARKGNQMRALEFDTWQTMPDWFYSLKGER